MEWKGEELKFKEIPKYVVYMEGGGMYESFINMIRVYDTPEECLPWLKQSGVYKSMKINSIELI